MICKYCKQGRLIDAKIIKLNKSIKICEECDTIFLENENDGFDFNLYMKSYGLEGIWDELEID